jgi:2-amino-4-hydroxy-6-hydroxymethyldihydropteridine diphosphokinase
MSSPIHKVYISGGSNQGDRRANLEYALEALKTAGIVSKASSFFETEPVGFLDQPWFLNLAIELETRLAPMELLELCQEIESSRERVRLFANAPRTLDLDILLYGDLVMKDKRLTIPHPRLAERRFVLKPLAQIAPEVFHPALKKTIRSLLEICSDMSQVREIDDSHPFSP